MTLPLVVLAGLSVVGGGLNLPFNDDTKALERWLEPVVHEYERVLDVGTGTKLAARRHRRRRRAWWASAWPWRCTSRSGSGPSSPRSWPRAGTTTRRSPRSSAGRARPPSRRPPTFDREVVDGAVNGTASLVQRAGKALRPVQSGYVRSYALGVAIGVGRPPRLLPHPGVVLMLTTVLASETSHGSVASSPLTVAIVLPFLGALAVALVPKARFELHRLVALLFAAGTGAITVWLLADVRPPRVRLPVRHRSRTGSRTSASPGTSASTGSRCSSSCCRACSSRWPSWPSRPTTTRSRTTRGCSSSRAAASACSARSTSSSSS